MNTTPLTDSKLDEIAGRAAGLYEYATGLDAAWQDEADQLAGTDVPALLATIRRLTVALDNAHQKTRELSDLAARRESELIGLRAQLHSEQQVHRLALRQRDNRSSRLVELRSLADAAAAGGAPEVQALIAAAQNTLAASLHDHAPAV